MSVWRHLRAVAFLPAMVTMVVPAMILLLTKNVHAGWRLPSPFAALPFALSVALFAAGLTLMVSTIRLFASTGRGTLAPWDPTQRLVVQGPYRHVRNPMITGVLCILLGEAAAFGSLWLLGWAGLFFFMNAVYFPLFEEPGLERRFGEEYRAYKRNVPRWLPRLTPWRADPQNAKLA
jgi:protein-S-isoprenylcysteine O-methyltransferase Ste14